jgi:hypothetical protein
MPNIEALWVETLGDPHICVAILDGPVDLSHPSLRRAQLRQLDTLAGGAGVEGPAGRHGTHIASLIFGQHDGPVKGIAPRCRGLSIPVFQVNADGSIRPTSQLDLARAISLAVQQGAQIINISGGQFSPSGMAHPLLAHVVRECARRGALIVAAAGNEGCECLHVPAALPSVLAVGAMNARGEPLTWSNWGGPYQIQGILAPGENILGALPGGGTGPGTGTSYATALVSGVAALLLSLQRQLGQEVNPPLIRTALLSSALGCDYQHIRDCRRLLAGCLNVNGASSLIHQGILTMSETIATQPPTPLNQQAATPEIPQSASVGLAPAGLASVSPSEGPSSGCGCQAAPAPPQLVYALGRIGYDLMSEARLDSLTQMIGVQRGESRAGRVLAFDSRKMLDYLKDNPWEAATLEWTLILDDTPIYAIRPRGPFAAETYKELQMFLLQQLEEGAERVSIPGVIAGKATLLYGQVVPVVVPELRGMASWTTTALVHHVVGSPPPDGAPDHEKGNHEVKKAGVRNFLDKVYHELRNLGIMPQERALNYAATNAFEIEAVYEAAMKEKMELESMNVTRSPICRPGSDCWDVELYFFYPEREVQTVRRVHRFTVDVSDIVPVTVGERRSWFTR